MQSPLTLLGRALREFSEDNCTQMAAAISYYVLFSLFPLLIFLVGVLGLFLQNKDLQVKMIDGVLDFIPLSEEQGRNDVTEAVRGVAGVASGALGVVGLLGMAWAGSNMFGAIRRSLNTAFDVEQRRPLVQQKLVDFALMAGLFVFLLASVAATVFLRTVREFSDDIAYLGAAAAAAGFPWDAASFLVPALLTFLAFLALYRLAPAASLRLADVWPGAVAAALLFEVAKVAFTLYLQNFGNYDVVFGSLGAVAAFLFWIYLSANVMLLGAEIAAQYSRLRRGEYAPPEPAEPALPLHERLKSGLKSLFVREREGREG
ncbi:MAG: YihY/virulence factor BrkB family protein [Chloroflexi bacterium]|nr:YihY/virulence factor BrkB family protein [Chloroflexota bacterium]